jgi:pimeloyl-ACP methyl ester carboxylesterase
VLDAERVLTWLGELIEPTWGSPPALVGHARGGAIGARFAIEAGDRLSHLVLVDSLGLARFRPSPRFAFGLVGFVARPSERSCERVTRQCAFDLGSLRRGWARTGSRSPTRCRLSVQGPHVKRGVRVDNVNYVPLGWGVGVGPTWCGDRARAGAQAYLGPRPLWGRRHDG